VPAFLQAARLLVNEREFAKALDQVTWAAEYEPENAEARLLKGELLIVQQQFAEAADDLDKYLAVRPQEPGPLCLRTLCRQAQRDDLTTQLAFATAFSEQRAFPLADGMLRQRGANSVTVWKQLLKLYQKRIDAAWPGLGIPLQMDGSGRFGLDLGYHKQVTDLAPLKGLPLTWLSISNNDQVRDLTPLKGMPLTSLNLNGCGRVRDLTPLQGMLLTTLFLTGCGQVRDLTPLQGMKLTKVGLPPGTSVHDL
jgi:tetratricopeptide (TPR) repeat protein